MKVKYHFLILLSFLLLSSCASSQYIGKNVQYNQIFCKKALGECSGEVRDFYISYSIDKDGDGYKVKGEATRLEEMPRNQLYSQAFFTIYLIKDFNVVQAVTVAGVLGSKITFQRKFKSDGFDSSSIGYSFMMQRW